MKDVIEQAIDGLLEGDSVLAKGTKIRILPNAFADIPEVKDDVAPGTMGVIATPHEPQSYDKAGVEWYIVDLPDGMSMDARKNIDFKVEDELPEEIPGLRKYGM